MQEIITRERGAPARTIDEITADIRLQTRTAATAIVTIGEDLMEAKAQLAHGEWLPWLDTVGIPDRTAQSYMRIAREATKDPVLATLPYTKAVALLGMAAEDRHDLLAEHPPEDTTAAEYKRLVRERDEARSERDQAAAQAKAMYEDFRLARSTAAENAQAKEQAEQRLGEVQRANQALRRQLDDAVNHPTTVEIVREVVPQDYDRIKRELAEALDAAAEAEEKAANATRAAQKAGMLSIDGDTILDQDTVRADQFVQACGAFAAEWSALPWLEELTVVPAAKLEMMAAKAEVVRRICEQISDVCRSRARTVQAEGRVIV